MIVLVDRDGARGGRGSRALSRALNRAVGGARGVSAGAIATIGALVEEYLAILGEQDLPRPRLEFRANILARWLGVDVWRPSDPSTTTLLLQKSILGHPRTLERVGAHEVIHHVDFMRMSAREVEAIRLGARTRDGHGASFLEKAALINARMGDGFVTVRSDEEYVRAKNARPFFLLIAPLSEPLVGGYYSIGDRFGWAWAARLSPDGSTRAAQKLALGARLVATTDERWLAGA